MNFSLSIEEKAILLLSRINLSREALSEVHGYLIHNDFDYEKFLSLANRNGVAPLLYKTLKDLSDVPSAVTERLQNIYYAAFTRNTRDLQETFRILRLLKDQTIKAIPLKGALASEAVFNDPGIYYGTDIDLLIEPKDLGEVKALLIADGYQYDDSREQAMRLSHYHIVFRKGKHYIEVHWNLVKRYFRILPEFWWEQTKVRNYEQQNIICLSPEKYLLYLIFRLYSHQFYPLKFFIIISALINTNYGNMDWEQFEDMVRRFRMKKLSVFAFTFMSELWDISIPSFAKGKRMRGYAAIKNLVLKGMFAGSRPPTTRKLYFLLLLDSTGDIVKVFLRRVFPDKGEILLRYKIPEHSKKIYLYYLLNPILLPFRVLKKREKLSPH